MGEFVTLINPPLLTQLSDKLGSGIPYMPVLLAGLAAVLAQKHSVQVIDAFGEDPFHLEIENGFCIQGLGAESIVQRLNPAAGFVVVYVSTIVAHSFLQQVVRAIRRQSKHIRILIMENAQGVIGCSLEFLARDYLLSGADVVVLGDSEERVPQCLKALKAKNRRLLEQIDGIVYLDKQGEPKCQPAQHLVKNLGELPFPAWEMFPLENYWKLGYAHGPMQGKYAALLTSRGCPFQCNFCVVPAMNHRKWRARPAEQVVAEMDYLLDRFGISDFHWEDLNPTANEKRIRAICALIIEKGLRVTWKLVSGSKIETLSLETLDLMHQAGCTYISFSPESGSKRVLQLMNKPFDHAHALAMTRRMHALHITTQACFVLGYPGETPEDLAQTADYARQLTRAGIDEMAFFIMTPIPGTKTFGQLTGYSDLAELTFAPTWRKDYAYLAKVRSRLYRSFFLGKCIHHPLKLVRQLGALLTRKFQSKAEMNIYRILWLDRHLKQVTTESL